MTPRILSIEDDPDFQQLILTALGELGFVVACAYTGPEGLERADEFLPDIILLDVMLPGFNGVELLRRLRLNEATREIPVIVLTAYSAEELGFEREVLALGAVACMRKPVRFDELHRLIHRVVFRNGSLTPKRCPES